VAGSSRYLGAAEMACRAAYRGGAGLVTLAAEARLPNSWPEIIFESLDWSKEALKTLSAIPYQRSQVRVLGPGLDERAKAFLPELIAQSDKPTVLDAGALEPSTAWLQAIKTHTNCVLTPHAGEAAKILNSTSSAVNLDPIKSAKDLVEMTGAKVVLKGATTVIASRDGFWLSERGHPGMATGGTGDILAGLIGSFIYNEDVAARVAAAVYVHGCAGELAAEHYGNGLVATDLLDYLPQVVRNLVARKAN
jgi:NAD(P)H-hydrate epimerase